MALAARYGSESLRHRRESGHGYDLAGAEGLDVRDAGFMRAAEALTGAPISWGDDVELLIKATIFPRYLETIRDAERTLFAGELTEQFERDLERSEQITPARWRRRGPFQRAGESGLKLARREL